MITFLPTDFHWTPRRFNSSDEGVKDAVEILNQLTEEQKEAVQLLSRSSYQEGLDDSED